MGDSLWDWGPEEEVPVSSGEDSQRQRLVAASVPLFVEQGFAGTSIRDLARAAGCTSSQVSYHFGGKEGLYREVVRRHVEVLEGALEDLSRRGESPLRRVVSLCRLIMGMHRRYPYLWRLVMHEMLRPTEALENLLQRAVTRIAGLLTETLREGIRQGVFREDLVPEYGTLALAGMLNFYFLSEPVSGRIIPRGAETDEAYAQQVVALFLDGVRRPEEDETR